MLGAILHALFGALLGGTWGYAKDNLHKVSSSIVGLDPVPEAFHMDSEASDIFSKLAPRFGKHPKYKEALRTTDKLLLTEYHLQTKYIHAQLSDMETQCTHAAQVELCMSSLLALETNTNNDVAFLKIQSKRLWALLRRHLIEIRRLTNTIAFDWEAAMAS